MYYPYLRGKQFELITIREMAQVLAQSGFVPIIEPVKETLTAVEKTLLKVKEDNGKAIVIANPCHGDHKSNGQNISKMLTAHFGGDDAIAVGVLLTQDTSVQDAVDCFNKHTAHKVVFVHHGFIEPKALAETMGDQLHTVDHVFTSEKHCGALYRKHFPSGKRVLLKDGFVPRKNADYPAVEKFSELHVTYSEYNGISGFGDYLIVGDDYSEGGGPAYAVAIHLTFIDPSKDDEMFIYHFKSSSNDTPTDPAGKFGEALHELIVKLDSGQSKLENTTAIQEFRHLHTKGHFPGLGYVKKLSMNHHIETLAKYFSPKHG